MMGLLTVISCLGALEFQLMEKLKGNVEDRDGVLATNREHPGLLQAHRSGPQPSAMTDLLTVISYQLMEKLKGNASHNSNYLVVLEFSDQLDNISFICRL